MKPLVAVLVVTYNHEKYISQTIQSILAQKTDFPFKLFIGEDRSADNTRNICISFRDQYPEMIELILHKKNMGWLSNFSAVHKTCVNSGAEYIALCEGDDCWTLPYKLQKQVDFLSANRDCAGCFHAANHVDANCVKPDRIHRPSPVLTNHKYPISYVIRKGGGFFSTASVIFRLDAVRELPDWFYEVPAGDSPLMMIAATKGKIGYIDEVMCLYRKNVKNSWSQTIGANFEKLEKYHTSHLTFLSKFDNWTQLRFSREIAFSVKWVNCSYLSMVILCASKSIQWSEYFRLFSQLGWRYALITLCKIICPTRVYKYLRNITV